VWKKFGKPFEPYTIPGLEEVLAQFTGDKKFADEFFAMYINGHESFDYRSVLEKAGIILKKANEGKPWIGTVRYIDGANVSIGSNTVIGSPLYEAGLDIDDQILQLDGKQVKKQGDIGEIIKDYKPGEKVSIEYMHHNERKTTSITIGENPVFTLTTFEKEGKPVTDAIVQFRKSWYGSKLK